MKYVKVKEGKAAAELPLHIEEKLRSVIKCWINLGEIPIGLVCS
jgi:hypothetical protein